MVSGFTSFISHAGAPPYQVHALALGHNPQVFAATAAVFFAIVNVAKLGPYFLLGQFDASNIATSLFLMPLAPLSTLAGAWLTRRIDAKVFFSIAYGFVFVIGLKLVHDGMTSLGWL